MNKFQQDLATFAKMVTKEIRHAENIAQQQATSRGRSLPGTLIKREFVTHPMVPFSHSQSPAHSRGASISGSRRIGLQVHSRTNSEGNLYVGLGPYGNLWDAPVTGGLAVVSIDGRLTNPADPDDAGWLGIVVGDNLYLFCELTDGNISSASLEIGSSSDLCEFTDYTQNSFRVILARGETNGDTNFVVPMHEGELIAFWQVIDSKLAKYAR